MSSESARAIQGPEELALPGPASQSVPEIQDSENMASPKSLQVAPDKAVKGGTLVGRQRMHRGDMSSFFPSGLMQAAGSPEGCYVRFLRRESMEKDNTMPC